MQMELLADEQDKLKGELENKTDEIIILTAGLNFLKDENAKIKNVSLILEGNYILRTFVC